MMGVARSIETRVMWRGLSNLLSRESSRLCVWFCVEPPENKKSRDDSRLSRLDSLRHAECN
jgi:hypothetical protein